MNSQSLIDVLAAEGTLPRGDIVCLIAENDEKTRAHAAKIARAVSAATFGHDIYIRALIEITNVCKNNCLYCGIRCGNANAVRYRMMREDILACCARGYALGFRTFVLQGGEDPYFTDARMTEIVSAIRALYPDCAITLSLGEKSRETYEAYFRAGANRYLLRHETADAAHYGLLHPPEMSFANRMRCLHDLKSIGFQTGCGCMVGSPYQTAENLADDLLFMKELAPEMIGIGPFLPHKDTPFHTMRAGSAETTLLMLSLARIMNPCTLIPATTALGTLLPGGRELGVLAGANVIMPNVSPMRTRERYMPYDNKLGTKNEAEESLARIAESMQKIGYRITSARGDYPFEKEKT